MNEKDTFPWEYLLVPPTLVGYLKLLDAVMPMMQALVEEVLLRLVPWLGPLPAMGVVVIMIVVLLAEGLLCLLEIVLALGRCVRQTWERKGGSHGA